MKWPKSWPRTSRRCRSAAIANRSGLGSAIDYAQRSVRSDAVIVHDGVTPIDAGEIRSLWRRWIADDAGNKSEAGKPATLKDQISDLANLPAIHAAMERAHGRLIGFQMVAPLQTDVAFDTAFEEYELPSPANDAAKRFAEQQPSQGRR